MIGNPPSLAAFFENWKHNKGQFLRYDGVASGRLSYADAASGAISFAEHLRLNGISQGEKLVFWSENRPEWVVALWGCLLAGVIAVPVDFRSSPQLVARIAKIVEARGLLVGDRLVAPPELPCPVWPIRTVVDHPRAIHKTNPANATDLAEILFTSGATGDPKGVTITHRNILANLKPISEGIGKYRRYMGPFQPIRFLNLLPLSHMFGQSMAALIPPMIAGEVYFSSSYSPRDIAHLIHRRRISVLVCVPQMLDLLRTYILQAVPESAAPRNSPKWYWSWWQYRRVHQHLGWKFWSFVVGAAPLDPELEEFWRKLGYVVIQGYGLTETAPVATLNHPMETHKGTVGKAISGVEIRIAPDGEILLRGENVTPGYYGEADNNLLDSEGWLHTGDIGELDSEKRLKILGRRKEMIVSPSGLNVYPEDVERVLNSIEGVRESAVIAKKEGANELVHAVLVLDPAADPDSIVTTANQSLESHQRIRSFSVWPGAALPRTSGTGKLRRTEVARSILGGPAEDTTTNTVDDILRRFTGSRTIAADTSLDDLGLSSLDRIQLLTEIEQRTGNRIDQATTVSDLTRPSTIATAPFDFPEWNRAWPARILRWVVLPTVILPLARLFAWVHTRGKENIHHYHGPVIFAANHQSHLDVPAIFWAMPGGWRYRTAPAMAKEFFDGHFHPERHTATERFTSSLNYYLSCLVFNAFPLPQREAGTREALRYAGDLASDGYSILIFPEGKRTEAGEILTFQPGVAMLAARLRIPVIPVRLEGLEKILHRTAKFPTPGRVQVTFGAPLTIDGDDYPALAQTIQQAVEALSRPPRAA